MLRKLYLCLTMPLLKIVVCVGLRRSKQWCVNHKSNKKCYATERESAAGCLFDPVQ